MLAARSIKMSDFNNEDSQQFQAQQNQPQQQGKSLYGKELRCMMYGFGDDKNPYTESVELLEELVLKYITDTTRKAMNIKRTGRLTVDDIMYLIRKDKRKCDRVKELLLMNEELKKSRKAFDLESLATHKHL
jgi:transcription initiation factor TFIID subunit 13